MSVAAADALAAASQARSLHQPAFIRVLEDTHITRLAQSAGDGPLAGIPFAVKDNLAVAGVPTTAACPALNEPADAHAGAVQRLIDAGAVPIGKTNMDQFATGLVGTRSPYGACHSVYSTQHVSGGSSSGSAVAVAAGIVPLALGTDTAGSGRVPAAFNNLVGMKPSRGLVSTGGLIPACPSLDCVTTFTRTVDAARKAFDSLVAFDPSDPYSRRMPGELPAGVARHLRVIGIPDGPLELEPLHATAWQEAVRRAERFAHVVRVDVEPFLAAARLLYEAPFVSERTAAFGQLLEPDGPHLDPTVRSIVLRGRDYSAPELFAAQHELQRLARLALPVFGNIDALLLPVTPWHPTLAAVATDPVGANSRNGVFTNMTNLLDLCAIALPAGQRGDGLPFGVQFLAPTFSDVPLLELAARWTGEADPDIWAHVGDRTLVAVAGAHLSGQPANPQLVGLGGRLHARARTAAGYRMFSVDGPFPRPGLVDSGDGPAGGIELEVWSLPSNSIDPLSTTITAPLGLGPLRVDDGSTLLGFVCDPAAADGSRDISAFGSWRGYLAAQPRP